MCCVNNVPTGSNGVAFSGDAIVDFCIAIVLSGIYEDDIIFLESEWCSDLLAMLRVNISGPELYRLYKSKGGLGYGRQKTQRSRKGTRLV